MPLVKCISIIAQCVNSFFLLARLSQEVVRNVRFAKVVADPWRAYLRYMRMQLLTEFYYSSCSASYKCDPKIRIRRATSAAFGHAADEAARRSRQTTKVVEEKVNRYTHEERERRDSEK